MKFSITFLSLFLSLTLAIKIKNYEGGSFWIADSIVNSEAGEAFMNAKVYDLPEISTSEERVREVLEENDIEKRITPENLYTLMCTEAGFRGNCSAFGAPAGTCADFYLYGTVIGDFYNDNVSCVSTNTGGMCQWYNLTGCDYDGRDRGISLAYAYNLSSTNPADYIAIGPNGDTDNAFTSWRC